MERSIEASTTIRVAFARACQVLLDDPGAVFSETHTVEQHRARRFRGDLSVDLGAGASAHQEVTMHLGAAQSTEAGLVLPLAWQATGRARLLPTFQGELEISETRSGTRLQLNGAYTVPLGALGKVGDGVVGHQLARRSLRALVDQLALRLESEVVARLESVGQPWEPIRVEPQEQPHPEIYVG